MLELKTGDKPLVVELFPKEGPSQGQLATFTKRQLYTSVDKKWLKEHSEYDFLPRFQEKLFSDSVSRYMLFDSSLDQNTLDILLNEASSFTKGFWNSHPFESSPLDWFVQIDPEYDKNFHDNLIYLMGRGSARPGYKQESETAFYLLKQFGFNQRNFEKLAFEYAKEARQYESLVDDMN